MTRSARTALLLCGLASACLAAPAAAQQPIPELAPDQRIRIAVPQESGVRRTAGTIAEVRGDSVVLTIHGMQETFALSSIQTLEVSDGRGSRKRFAVIGGLIGTAAGAGLGLYLHNNSHDRWIRYYGEICTDPADPSTCAPTYQDRREKVPLFTTVGVALAGTGVGAIVGALLPGDRWREVPLRVSATPQRATVALDLSL